MLFIYLHVSCEIPIEYFMHRPIWLNFELAFNVFNTCRDFMLLSNYLYVYTIERGFLGKVIEMHRSR